MKEKNIFIGIVIILVALSVYYLWPTVFKTKIINLDSRGTNVVAFGDSLIQGVGSSFENDFVSVLAKRIGQPIVNLGHSGDNTFEALARIDEIFKYNPRIVIVLFGGNDYIDRVPKNQTFSNLEKIVALIQSKGAAVLLLGIRGGLLTDAYNSDFTAFARSHGVGFVPDVLDGLFGDGRYMSDAVHPNDAGYKLIADKVEPILKGMLLTKL